MELNTEAQVMFFKAFTNNSNLIQSTEEWFIGYLFSLPGSFFPSGLQNKYKKLIIRVYNLHQNYNDIIYNKEKL